MKRTFIIFTELIILGALILSNSHRTDKASDRKYLILRELNKKCGTLVSRAEEIYMPVPAYLVSKKDYNNKKWIKNHIFTWLPLVKYSDRKISEENTRVNEMGIKVKEDQNRRISEEKKKNIKESVKNEPKQEEAKQEEPIVLENLTLGDIPIARLHDFDYLISNYYTVDSSTMIGPEQLEIDDLLGRSMKIDENSGGPKILIFHTHSQEAFVDSVEGDPETSIVGMGKYLCELLNEKGIETLHNAGVYDIIDGKLDRSNAFEQAEYSIRPILEENPSIEIVIDLHRDGVPETTHLVTEINGKPTAKIMYFNGLSRTKENGDIDYLYNPYIQDNLAFSLQMKLASDRLFPDFARRIYLRGYRYNLHLRPKSLLIEAGAQTNTVEEMRNAMEALAVVLQYVLTK